MTPTPAEPALTAICKTCGQEFPRFEKHNCPGLQPRDAEPAAPFDNQLWNDAYAAREAALATDPNDQISALAAAFDVLAAGLTDKVAAWDAIAGKNLTIATLTAERDEADRRAGAAERKLVHLEETQRVQQRWMDERKFELGYSPADSFDRVWADTLAKAKRFAAVKPLEWQRETVDGTFWTGKAPASLEYRVKFNGQVWEAIAGMILIDTASNSDAAKAICYEDHEKRIRFALAQFTATPSTGSRCPDLISADAAVRAALNARFGPPSSWGTPNPQGWHLARQCMPDEAAMHDNGCVDAAKAIRLLPAAKPFCWVREDAGFFDPQNGGEPPSIDFSPEPKPGYVALFKGGA